MIRLDAHGTGRCSPFSRRGFLKAIAPLASGLTIAKAGNCAKARRDTDVSVIQIWLGGGPSQYETYDMKPQAPAEIRGPFRPISTIVPGVSVCELLPKHAGFLKHFTVIRSLSHQTDNHHAASHWLQTGHYGPPSKDLPDQTRPSIGSVVSALRGRDRKSVPSNVMVSADPLSEPTLLLNFRSAYLGAAHEPLRIHAARVGKHTSGEHYFGDLIGKPQFAAPAIDLLPGMNVDRLHDRRQLLSVLEGRLKTAVKQFDGLDAHAQHRNNAFELVSRRETRNAFDLSTESEKTRRRYGNNVWGQGALLSRRLVEAGVRFVTLNLDAFQLAWDTHYYQEREFRKMLPVYDQMLAALVEDLVDRGLWNKVVLLVVGEFGRTSKINARAGRDHWGKAGVALLGGGPLPGGGVLGATDRLGQFPTDRPITPGDLLATIYHTLAIDHTQMLKDRQGRPLPILSEGEPLHELVL